MPYHSRRLDPFEIEMLLGSGPLKPSKILNSKTLIFRLILTHSLIDFKITGNKFYIMIIKLLFYNFICIRSDIFNQIKFE